MTTKHPTADNNYSIEKLILGDRNSKVRTEHIESALANGIRLLRQDYVVNPPTLPAANRKIRVFSNNVSDTVKRY